MEQNLPKQQSSIDPAGADRLLLSAAEGLIHWGEGILRYWSGNQLDLDLWNGPNGAKGVVEECIQRVNVPNKRFFDIVTPRSIAEEVGVVPKKVIKRRRVKK